MSDLVRSIVRTSSAGVDLSIIVPAFNEEHRITPTLRALDAFLSSQRLRYEIIVIPPRRWRR